MLKPWWRSVAFWLGLWTLAFLVWAWVDSFTHVSTASSAGVVKVEGYDARGPGYRALLQDGRCVYQGREVNEASSGAVILRSPLSLTYQRYGVFPIDPYPSPWGARTSVNEVMSAPGKVSLKTVEWWFPFGFVVAGYAVVWLGSLVMWRRWVRGRMIRG
jgi:hypothetical protein